MREPWRDDVAYMPTRLPASRGAVEGFLYSLYAESERTFPRVEIAMPREGGHPTLDYWNRHPQVDPALLPPVGAGDDRAHVEGSRGPDLPPSSRSALTGLCAVPGLTSPASASLFGLVEGLVMADVEDGALLDACSAGQALISALTARMFEATAEFHARRTAGPEARLAAAQARTDPFETRAARRAAEIAHRATADELALQLSCSRMQAQGQVDRALILTQELPATFDALAAGRIEPRKASLICDLVGSLSDPEIRSEVEAWVLPKARGWNLPTLREEIKKQILRLDPQTAGERHAKARQERRLVFTPADDDMIELWALLPADDGIRVRTALDIVADQACSPDDTRTADQRRCDALVDAVVQAVEHPADCCPETDAAADGHGDAEGHGDADCDGDADASRDTDGDRASRASLSHKDDGSGGSGTGCSPPTGRQREAVRKHRRRRARRALRHEVQVVVPLETITGDAEEPGYLARYGPISAALARSMAWDVARSGSWRCVVTDDVHGTVLGLGRSTFTPAYEASEQLRRHLDVRDRVCTFPGCRAPAAGCDKDHQIPYPAGHTCEGGLWNRCGHHHRVKHETATKVRVSSDPDHPPGTVVWTTPSGREYVNLPAAVGIPRAGAQPSKLRPRHPGTRGGVSGASPLGPPPF